MVGPLLPVLGLSLLLGGLLRQPGGTHPRRRRAKHLGCPGLSRRSGVQLRLQSFRAPLKAAVTMSGRPTLFRVVVSPKDPPRGASPALGLLLCRSVRSAAFVSGVAPGADRGHGMDGWHPGHYLLGSVHDVLAKDHREAFARMALGSGLPKRRVLGRQLPGTAGWVHPVVTAAAHVASWSRLRWLVLPVGHAQQFLQLLGAAPGGQDLCGGLQPAQHEHGQGRGGWVVRVD
jgi:hypothetical protein